MTEDHMIRAGMLGFIGLVMAWYLFVQNRGALRSLLRHAAMWVFIFTAIVTGYGLWTDTQFAGLPRQAVFATDGRVEVPRGFDGHYHVSLVINGVSVPFVVDTGASDLVLSAADAKRVGIDPDSLIFTGRANTANGQVQTASVQLLEVKLGDIRDEFVPAIVTNGDMRSSLLGMSYLGRFDRLEISDNRLILVR